VIGRQDKLTKDNAGNAAVEFALVAPLLCLLMMGMAYFGIALNNYVVLTDAVAAGARNLSLSRGSSTPYSSTTSLINSSAAGLTTASITVTVTVNGTTCSADNTCQTALNSAQGQTASVSATYPCNLVVYANNYAPGCTLSASTSERIE
jgi:Flp pilus assembly protein TadG